MHILKIIHGYPPEYNAGSEVYSQSICDELKKRHKVSVFTRTENQYLPDFHLQPSHAEGLDFYRINMARERDGYNHQKVNETLAELLNEIQPDVAHIGHLNHLSTGLVAELKRQDIPIAFTLHDFWLMCPRGQFLQINFGNKDFHQLCSGQEDQKCASHCYNRFFSGLPEQEAEDLRYWTNWISKRMQCTRSLTKLVDLFIAPSKHLLNRFVRDFTLPKERITYLDYGFPTHYLQPVIPTKKGTFTFGYIGTHIPSKGIDLLINAFAEVQEKAKLLVFGRNLAKNTSVLKDMANKSQNPIHFCGEYINQNLAKVVFSEVDCIVVPSIWTENSPLVIHEAQACGIPVITADVGGMAEYVQHKTNGLLFKHRDQNSLTEQLQYAARHPAEMKTMGKRGYLYSADGTVPDIAQHCLALEKIFIDLINQTQNA